MDLGKWLLTGKSGATLPSSKAVKAAR